MNSSDAHAILAKPHRISMEERFARASALLASYLNKTFDTMDHGLSQSVLGHEGLLQY
jgi:hypothetical protein